MNPTLIAVFIVLDLAVTAVVIAVVMRIRKAAGGGGAGSSRRLDELRETMAPEVEQLLRGSWDGNADSLPGTLESLLARLTSESQARDLSLDRAQLKALLVQIVARRGLADPRAASEALRRVA